LWRADLEFTFRNVSPTTVRGYHAWATPYVKLMRKHAWAERIMLPIARSRAEEIGHIVGIRERGSLMGKCVRVIMEPMCYAIGLFVGEQDWESLWADKDVLRQTVA
jgi:hypothetical protein